MFSVGVFRDGVVQSGCGPGPLGDGTSNASCTLRQTPSFTLQNVYVKHLLTLAALALLQACVVVPRTDSVYDEECKYQRRQMVLEVQQIGAFGGCANDGCVALLVGAGVVAAASAVVSSSIAVVGNVVYWFERQGRCARP